MGCMCETAMVSIIVPIYNVEAYLKECIDSIRGQTMQEMDIILVDDGSPDSCPQICDQFAAEDKRIRVFHRENMGVSAARNFGMEQAEADWIMFVDPDDWLEKDGSTGSKGCSDELRNCMWVVLLELYWKADSSAVEGGGSKRVSGARKLGFSL